MNNRHHTANGNMIYNDTRFAMGSQRIQKGFRFLVPMSVAMNQDVARFEIIDVRVVAETSKVGPSFQLEIEAKEIK